MSGKISEMDKSSGIYKNYALFCKLIQKAFESDPDLNAERIENRGQTSSCSVSVLLDRLNERRSQCQEKR